MNHALTVCNFPPCGIQKYLIIQPSYSVMNKKNGGMQKSLN